MAAISDRGDRLSGGSQEGDDDWKIVSSRPHRSGKEKKADWRSEQPGGAVSGSKSGKGRGGYFRTRGERRSNEIMTASGDRATDDRDHSFRTGHTEYRTGHTEYRTRESPHQANGRPMNGRTTHESSRSLFADRKLEGDSISDKVGKPIILRGIGPRGSPNAGRKHFRNDTSKGRGRFDSMDERTGTESKRESGNSSKLPRGLLRLRPGMETHLRPGSPELDRAMKEEDYNFSLANEDWPGVSSTSVKRTGEEGEGGEAPKWAAIVKTRPSRPLHEQPPKPTAGDTSGTGSENEGGGDAGSAKKKKKKTKKKKGTSQPVVQEERRRNQPLMFEFSSMFDALTSPPQPQQGQKPGKVVMATGSIPVIPRPQKSEKMSSPANKDAVTPRNILDSSAPVQRRGKERETVKKKKPSNMRKIISKEKEEKRRLREQGLPVPPDLDVMKENSDLDGHSGDEPDPAHEETPPTPPHPPAMHSRKFREYCSHVVLEDLNECVSTLLQELVRFQDRQYLRDPIKAHARRRYVCGMREVAKHLRLRKLKCVIVPPNLDKIQSTGGVTDTITQIVAECREQGIPTVFALSRRRLAMLLKKKHKIGCVGIFSYDGAELHYRKMLELVETATERYQSETTSLPQSEIETSPGAALSQSSELVGEGQSGSLSQDSSSDSISTDTLGEMENGNKTQPVDQISRNQTSPKSKSIRDTPWKIFIKSDADVSNTPASHKASLDSGHHPKADLAAGDAEIGCHGDTTAKTMISNGVRTGSTPHCQNIGPPEGTSNTAMHPGEASTDKFQFNITAAEFVPSFQFSLNVNAMEFTPNLPPSSQTTTHSS